MCAASSQRRLTVDWDSTLRLWKKKPEQDGFFELLEPFSETWPASGSMRSGRASAHRRSALPTNVSAYSSSPGLPTPRARDWKGRDPNPRGIDLNEAVALLPTPTVSEANGIGHAADGGMNLRHTVSLLPTPRASENENRQTKRSPSQEAGTHGKCLAAEVAHLLPTPVASDGERQSSTYSRGNPTLAGALLPTPTATPYGNNQSPSPGATVRPSLDSLAPTLLPTPRATDGTKGGPNQRGSKGDLMLPSAVSQMSSGASTSPPSAAGSASSDGLLPGQLTIADA